MKNKKGFTLVELVIVIAVIAILAGVMIGTFASVIRKAHMSNDVQLVRNLNTALRADIKEHKTMQEALDAAADFDYDVSIITASASGNEILWDSVNDYFCYFDKDNDSISYYPEIEFKDGKAPEDYQLWKIYSGKEKVPATQTYSVYWNKDVTTGLPTTLNVGFDAGENTAITELTYERSEEGETEQKVTFRTNEGTKLTINAANDTVNHYGKAACADVKAVADNSYHVYGEVELVKISQGRVKVEAGGNVETVLATTNDATVDKDKSGVIENAYKAAGVTDENAGNVALKSFSDVEAPATTKRLHVTESNCNYTLNDCSITLPLTGDTPPCVYFSDTDVTFDLSGGDNEKKYVIIAKCSDGVIIYNGTGRLFWWSLSANNKFSESKNSGIANPADHTYRTQLIDNKIIITGSNGSKKEYNLENLKTLFSDKNVEELVLGYTRWVDDNKCDTVYYYDAEPIKKGTVNCLGDSITDASGAWGHYTAALSAMGYTVNNYGKGGTTISSVKSDPFYKRIEGMSGDCDFIFMLGGTNDWNAGVDLGTENDTAANTFYGGLYVTLEALREKFPDKPIYVSTIMQRTRAADSGSGDTNKNQNTIEKFNEAIIYMAQKFDCIVVDGYSCITKINAGTDLTDGLHPSATGAAKYAAFLDAAFQATKQLWQ